MCAVGTGGVAKAGLPQQCQIKQAFDQDKRGEPAHRLPGKQSALGARQQPVREGGANAAAVQVDDLAVPAAGEDHTAAETIMALTIDQPGLEQPIEAIAQSRQMTMQVSTGRVADAQLFDQGGIAQPALFQILHRLPMPVQLQLVEAGGLLH